MPRNPELDKLLREVDELTNSQQAALHEEYAEPDQPVRREQGSSFLNKLGGFFITRVEDETAETSAPPPTPHTVEEVALNEPAPEFEVDSDDMATRDFAEIYREAGVDESSFTVDRLAGLLQDPTLRDQPLSTKALVLKMALKAQNVSPEVPVNDAIKRDRALDAFQRALNQRALETEARNSQMIQEINAEVKRFLEQKNAEMDALRSQSAEMKRQAEVFAARRLEEEQRLAEIIVPLLEGQPNPVTTGNKVE